ncbi:putative RNA 2'-phosphotransferase [Desulfobotulus alkaliphilus]|uniref:Putative RNA 2'-phosphotransferase n=1 Tax=Desulfobotulus alkaliphilus TaxID=622671 RepID=A0A562S7J0_9BACT|nr:RNA 2'-phosphotransferase [Desulfobotulus alkaliphilus]TWI77401.1 putative RNA 2'-phosphotransferase [Desulfobotulus alkaliphilus]
MQRDKKLNHLGKILATLLGRHPDSHGLLPDEEGWVSIKGLLQALSESPDLRGVREGDLKDICMNMNDAPLEMQDGKIRAKVRPFASERCPAEMLPKILHTCVRSRAWPHVSEKGLHAAPGNPLLLSKDPELALRMGKRKDPRPTALQVQAFRAATSGISFMRHGEDLFSAEAIPNDFIQGPPVIREEKKKKAGPEKPVKPKETNFSAGSFILRSEEEKAAIGRSKKQKDSWKHNKKRLRRQGEGFKP